MLGKYAPEGGYFKKGNMTATTSLKDQLRKLVELQAMDVDIYALKGTLRERPAEIEQSKVEFEAKKSRLKQLEDKLTDKEHHGPGGHI